MIFKKIYIEITNVCNLNCSFCAKHTRDAKMMDISEFEFILDKIKGYTKYIYLHVMGEPLMHPDIEKFINLTCNKGFYVQMTTNGYLIERLTNCKGLRQINISLHSYAPLYGKTLEEYLNSIYSIASKKAEEGTFINYRLWVESEASKTILKKLENKYNISTSESDKTKTLAHNIFYSKENSFVWPSDRLEKGKYSSLGKCLALKDHIAILVDGTIVPCCLDNNANIPLGNIFSDNLEDVVNSSLYQEMFRGFQNNKKIHPLCQKCDFYDTKF